MSDNVLRMIRTFRELYHEHSEHTAIEWLRDVFTELERESAERQRLSRRNHDLTHKIIELSDEIERLRNL